MSDTIRLFVGTGARNEDLEAQAVLEYTARTHCSMPLEITWMRQSADDPIWGGWDARRWRTPFSGYRWAIPAACGYQGRGIYTDVDFFFLGDLADLWSQSMPESCVMAMKKADGKLRHSSAILFDNAKCKGHIPGLDQLKRMHDAHDEMLAYFKARRELIATFDHDWNCTAYEKLGATIPPFDLDGVKAYHFTRIETQIHLKYAIPRLKADGTSHWYTGEVFPHPHQALQSFYDGLLREAIVAGYTTERYRVTPYAQATRKDFTYSSHVGVRA